MIFQMIEILFRSGSGFLFSTLFGDVMLLTTVVYMIKYFIIPFIKAYKHATLLDELAGSNSRHWFFGHMKKYNLDADGIKNSVKRTESFPATFNLWLLPALSTVHVVHPDVTIALTTSGAPKSEIGYGIFRPWLGDGLLLSKGKKWLRNRRLLTPAFHYSILKPYTDVFNNCARTLLAKWEDKVRIPVELSEPMSLLALDTMLQCTMSSETNCQQVRKHPYIDAMHDLANGIVTRYQTPYFFFDWIFYLSQTGRKFKKACDVVHGHAEKLINERRKILLELQHDEIKQKSQNNEEDVHCFKKTGKNMLDFVDVLLQTKDEDGKGLTDREIRDEVDTFLFEGHDTTASGMSWALYNLAKYPNYQEKCREEIISVVGDKDDVEWQDLSKLSYLTMFLKESMRLFPPVIQVGRCLDEPLKLNNKFQSMKEVTIPKNSCMDMHIYSLHRNKHVWENPDVFDPERFSKENQAKRSPHAYLPFSAGSRNCIGQNFAMNEMKVVLSQVLRKYRLYLDEETPVPIIKQLIILWSESGIFIKFKPVADEA